MYFVVKECFKWPEDLGMERYITDILFAVKLIEKKRWCEICWKMLSYLLKANYDFWKIVWSYEWSYFPTF